MHLHSCSYVVCLVDITPLQNCNDGSQQHETIDVISESVNHERYHHDIDNESEQLDCS